MSKDILVVKKETLFPHGFFQGFLPLQYVDFDSIIKNNFEYKERNDELENDSSFIQIIPYVWLINKEKQKVFIYQRAPGTGSYTDKRYINKLSGGVGGHIDRDTEESANDPVTRAMERELREELVMQEYPEPRFFGYIKDNSDMFNLVHLGIVGVAQTNNEAQPADGMKKGKFYSIEEVDALFSDVGNAVEPWTRISWPFVKEFLLKN